MSNAQHALATTLLCAIVFCVVYIGLKRLETHEPQNPTNHALNLLLKELHHTPGSPASMLTFGTVNGYAYIIDIKRNPELDDTAAMRREAEALRHRATEIEKQLKEPK